MSQQMNPKNKSQETVVIGERLPDIPNWLPFSTTDDAQSLRNFEAICALASGVYQTRWPEWIHACDNAFSDRLQRCRDAGYAPLWREVSSEKISGRVQ